MIKSIIFSPEVITVASVQKNVGADGVFLALVCDFVVASKSTIFNPHYKTIGLSGSEYHTYSLPKRVGGGKSKRTSWSLFAYECYWSFRYRTYW